MPLMDRRLTRTPIEPGTRPDLGQHSHLSFDEEAASSINLINGEIRNWTQVALAIGNFCGAISSSPAARAAESRAKAT